MDRWTQDLKYALRAILKSPQHAILATFTLSLAIGVNVAIFSLVGQLLFLDLPMENPDELYWVWSTNPEVRSDITLVSIPDFQDFRDRTRSFQSLAAMQQAPVILTGLEEPERITVARVTANLTDVWGDEPVLGRGFVEGEDLEGAPGVAMITHSMWQERFGADPLVLGRTLRLDDRPYSIVGVASTRMEMGNLGRARVLIPLEISASGEGREDRGTGAFVTGRLRPGVGLAEAQAEGAAIGRELAELHPVTNQGWEVQVRDTDDSLIDDSAQTVFALLAISVGLVLLIACANVANLVLVRASSRMRELAVRSAVGASAGRIVRQLLTENVLVALVAGGVGVGLAYVLLRALVLVTRGQQVLFTMAEINQHALLFTLAVSLTAPLVFGLLPAVAAARSDLAGALRDGERSGGGRRGGRTRNLLVVSQVALALSLMTVASVLVRSVIAQQSFDRGYEADGVLSMVIDLPDTRYDSGAAGRFFGELETRVGSLPTVERVAFASRRPEPTLAGGVPFAIEGRAEGPLEDLPTAHVEWVTVAYFGVLGIPLLRGRVFDGQDRAEAAPVALVSREAEERYWPEGDALGRRVRLGDSPAPWREVVGVVGNVVGGSSIASPDVPQVYLPLDQSPRTSMVLLARGAGDVGSLSRAIRGEVWALDPFQPIDDVRTMRDFLYDRNSFSYALVSLFVAFALFALAMAGMGVYGVTSFMVSLRTREIGLRVALGAERRSVLGMVLAQGARLLALGTLLGVAAGLLLSRMTASLVEVVDPYDLTTLVGVPLLLLLIALVAAVIPARRATLIDPMQTLRSD